MLTEDKTNADFIWYKIKTHTRIPKPLLLSACYLCFFFFFFTNINIFGQIIIEGRGEKKTQGALSAQKSFPLPKLQLLSQNTEVTNDFKETSLRAFEHRQKTTTS